MTNFRPGDKIRFKAQNTPGTTFLSRFGYAPGQVVTVARRSGGYILVGDQGPIAVSGWHESWFEPEPVIEPTLDSEPLQDLVVNWRARADYEESQPNHYAASLIRKAADELKAAIDPGPRSYNVGVPAYVTVDANGKVTVGVDLSDLPASLGRDDSVSYTDAQIEADEAAIDKALTNNTHHTITL